MNATFNGIPYRGQVVKMGAPCYVIGVTKQIRKQIGKTLVILLKWFFGKETERKALCGNAPNVAESSRKRGRVITAVKSQRRLMNIS